VTLMCITLRYTSVLYFTNSSGIFVIPSRQTFILPNILNRWDFKAKEIMMKFTQAISRVKWLSSEKTNISKTISVLVHSTI
jgi:hypothetical protein